MAALSTTCPRTSASLVAADVPHQLRSAAFVLGVPTDLLYCIYGAVTRSPLPVLLAHRQRNRQRSISIDV